MRGEPPALDLVREKALQALLAGLRNVRIRSAHDCADGGLAVALAECCFDTQGIGAQVSIEGVHVSRSARVNEAAALFGESASRVLVSATPDAVAEVLQAAAAAGVPARVIGETGGNRLRVAVAGRRRSMRRSTIERIWTGTIERQLPSR